MRKILVVGGTGVAGSAVIHQLHAAGWTVRALSRTPERLPEQVAEPIRGDLQQPATLPTACQGVDAVFSCAGASLALALKPGSPGFHQVDYLGNLNLLRAAEAAGVPKFVYLSVHTTAATAETAYVRAHTAFAQALEAAPLASAVVEPTGFFPAFDLFLPLARLGVAPRIGTGAARTNPIHPTDLALRCVQAIEHETGRHPVGGPVVYSRDEIAAAAFEAVGRKPRFISAPAPLLAFNRTLVGGLDSRLRDFLHFLSEVSKSDAIAPAFGSRTLDAYFKERACSRQAASSAS